MTVSIFMLGDESLNIFEIMASRFEALELNTSLGLKDSPSLDTPVHLYFFINLPTEESCVAMMCKSLSTTKMCLFLCEKDGRCLF